MTTRHYISCLLIFMHCGFCWGKITVSLPSYLKNHWTVTASKSIANNGLIYPTLVNGEYFIEATLTSPKTRDEIINDLASFTNNNDFSHEIIEEDSSKTILQAKYIHNPEQHLEITLIDHKNKTGEIIKVSGPCQHPNLERIHPSLLKEHEEFEEIIGEPFFTKEVFQKEGYSGTLMFSLPLRHNQHFLMDTARADFIHAGWEENINNTTALLQTPDVPLLFMQNKKLSLLLAEVHKDDVTYISATINSRKPIPTIKLLKN